MSLSSPRANGDPKARVEGYFPGKRAVAMLSALAPLAKTLVVPSTSEATVEEDDQQWSRGGQSRAVAPGNAAAT